MQYYIEYTLGIRGNGGKKADKGTITHKILEVCALAKKAIQEGKETYQDEEIGEVITNNYDPKYLKQISLKVYNYYTNKFDYHVWEKKDFKDCFNWAWKALHHKGGMFDPRNRDIVDAEPHFDFEIKEDWAKFDYPKHDLKGYLSLKGTIDLISDMGDGVYEVLDWKTGMRKDWATDKEKTQENLFYDPQLRLYHYAVKRLYPHVHTFLITIYYINTGGPFTILLQDSDLEDTEKIIKTRFEAIRDTEMPTQVKTKYPHKKWKCTKFCDAGMNSFEEMGSNIVSIDEFRFGKIRSRGEKMSICDQVQHMIKEKGIDWVTDNYIHPDHSHGRYGSGGGKIQD